MATTGPYNATLALIYIDGTAVAYSTDFSFSFNRAEIDVTSKDSSGWADTEYGLGDWSGSCNFIHAIDSAANLSAIFGNMNSKTKVNVKMSTDTSGDKYYHGTAVLTSLNASFPMEDKATGDFNFKGDGALTESTKT